MAAFQAVVDDSGTGGAKGGNPVFVLAGYLSTPDKWCEFATEWRALLDRHGLESFKMNKAVGRWFPKDDFCSVEEFYRVIERYVEYEFRVVVPYAAYNSATARLPFHIQGGITYFAFTHLFEHVARGLDERGIAEEIDFVFDSGLFDEGMIRRDWDKFRDVASPKGKRMIGAVPQFRSDTEYVPLQAADFTAWWTLKGWRDHPAYKADRRYPWPGAERGIPGFEVWYEEADIYGFLHRLGIAITGGTASR